MDPSSDLRTSFLKSKLSTIPHLASYAPNSAQAQAAADGLAKAQFDGQSTNDDSTGSGSGNPNSNIKSRDVLSADYSPLTSSDCFEQALEIDVQYPLPSSTASTSHQSATLENKATFRVYYTPPKPKPKGKGKGKGKVARDQAAFPSPFPFPSASTQPPKPSDETLASLSLPNQGEGLGQEEKIEDEEESGKQNSTVFVLHHGAGFSALSYALCAKEISNLTDGEAGVFAFDCRGHGRTCHPSHSNPPPNDFSLQTLTLDLFLLLNTFFSNSTSLPSLVLVGHSLGGTVCSEFSLVNSLLSSPSTSTSNSTSSSLRDLSSFPKSFHPKISGLAVLDVVEGTAMSALPGMKNIVLTRPKGFDSIQEAIKWHVENGDIRNEESARRSVPSLIRKREKEDDERDDREQKSMGGSESIEMGGLIEEDEEDEMEELKDESISMGPPGSRAEVSIDETGKKEASKERSRFKRYPFLWRADLLATSPFWSEWFTGLSKKFLQAKTARLLLLAGTDRLDKELMIGQMQGKYQLVVFQEVGHSLQEDAPKRTATTLVDFWRRNDSVVVVPNFLKKKYHIE